MSPIVVAVIALTACQASAQPEFEAVSVKASVPAAMGPGGAVGIRVGSSGGPGSTDPGRIDYKGITMRALVLRAYGVKPYQISGPAWMESERFDIAAKLPPETSKEQLGQMLQKLLADRFQMVVHRETKDLPIYILRVGKNGPKLKESKEADGEQKVDPTAAYSAGGAGGREVRSGDVQAAPRGVVGAWMTGAGQMGGRQSTMASLADLLSVQLDRPVKDMTELTGKYDFRLDFAPDETQQPRGMPAAHSSTPDAPAGPSVFAAIQDQLGLKLEAAKGPVELLVIDRAEKSPRGN